MKIFWAAAVLAASLSSVYAAPTNINFDGTGAPCAFADTVPLTNAYAGNGVTFNSGGGAETGAILNQCGNFGFSARSGTDFLAFNTNGSSIDLNFASAISAGSIWAASAFGASFTLTAFDAQDSVLATSTLTGSGTWQELSFSAAGATKVRLSTDNQYGAYDDLSFDQGAVQEVPEPASLALVVLGLLTMGAVRRKAPNTKA